MIIRRHGPFDVPLKVGGLPATENGAPVAFPVSPRGRQVPIYSANFIPHVGRRGPTELMASAKRRNQAFRSLLRRWRYMSKPLGRRSLYFNIAPYFGGYLAVFLLFEGP